MGGFFRAVTRIFKSKPAQVQVVQQASPVQADAPTKVNKRQTLAASGHGGSTIMTGSEGVEDEANVAKTALGMGKKKKYTI